MIYNPKNYFGGKKMKVLVVGGGGGGGADCNDDATSGGSGGGGSGGGVTIQPLCFLVVKNGDVKILHVNSNNSTGAQALNMIPDVIDKISGIVKKDKPAAPQTSEQ